MPRKVSLKKFIAAFVFVAFVEWIAFTVLFDDSLAYGFFIPYYLKLALFMGVQAFQGAVTYFITRG